MRDKILRCNQLVARSKLAAERDEKLEKYVKRNCKEDENNGIWTYAKRKLAPVGADGNIHHNVHDDRTYDFVVQDNGFWPMRTYKLYDKEVRPRKLDSTCSPAVLDL